MALQIPNGPVRVFMGEQYTWSQANECVKSFQPGWSLVSANQSLQQPGGLELTLLKQALGKYIMMMTYFEDGIKLYHCAFFDAGEKWKREYHVKGWLFGHGVLKDNQADVGIHYSEDVDRESVASARGFFQGPYKVPMRIESVWLMSKVVEDDENSNHDRNDNEARGDREQRAPSVMMECPDDDGDLKVAACEEACDDGDLKVAACEEACESESSDEDDSDNSDEGESSDDSENTNNGDSNNDGDDDYEYFNSSSSYGECCCCSTTGPVGLTCDWCIDTGGTFQGKWVP